MKRYTVFLIFLLSGCATVPPEQSYQTIPAIEALPSSPQIVSKGVYHKVQKGETLYRISRAYNVSIQEIVKANNITDPGMITEGQLIYIPGAKETLSLSSKEFIWPVNGKIITKFQESTKRGINKGIDIFCQGDYKVRAVKSGVVSYAGSDLKGYGNVVIIDHGNNLYSVYAYAYKVVVNKGDFVNQGEEIALLSSQHPVLHFEIREGHKPVNPLNYLGVER